MTTTWTCTNIATGAAYAGATAEDAYRAYLADYVSETGDNIDIAAATAAMADPNWDDAAVTLRRRKIVLVNLTPHSLTLRTASGDQVIAPSGMVARVATTQALVGEIAGVPLVLTQTGSVSGIPAEQAGVVYVASSMVAAAAGRADVVAPDTGATAIRENGQVVAVTRLQTF